MATKQINRANKWGDTSRTYQVPNGEEYPSVTSILSSIAKPALVAWSAKVEREAVLQAAADLYEDLPIAPKMARVSYLSTLTTRLGKVNNYRKELAKASEIGTQVHGLIEWNLRRELGQVVGPEPHINDAATWAFMVFQEWRSAHQFKPRRIEQVVYSAQHRYAGTMDWDGLVDGVMTVGDWKSGRAIYGEALLQNAAYVHALIELGHASPPVQGCIVRLPKVETDPEPEMKLIPWAQHEELFEVFCAVKRLWEWQQTKYYEKPESDPLMDEIKMLLECLNSTPHGTAALVNIYLNFGLFAGCLPDKPDARRFFLEALRETVDVFNQKATP